MSAESILGLTEDLLPANKSGRSTIKIGASKPEREKTDTIISKSFFRDKTVYINLTDTKIIERIQNSLTQLNVKIIRDMLLAEIIISPTPVKLNLPNPNSSRGALLLKNASIIHELPKLVLLKQIPWAVREYEPEKFINVNELTIVADLFSRYRPNFQRNSHNPKIHLGYVPKGYTITPFEQIPTAIEPTMKRIQSHLKPRDEADYVKGPQDGDYCEICGCSFQNAEQHHNSPEHIYNSTDHVWEDFDCLANLTTQKKYQKLF